MPLKKYPSLEETKCALMKNDIIDILACPNCKGDLELKVTKQKDQDILEGSLTCSNCNEVFSIDGGIPNLLPTITQD